MFSPDLLKSFMHTQLLETHQSQTPGWDFYQLSVSFGAKNGQWREAVGPPLMDYVVRITMTKHMETITVSMTTPLFAATVWGISELFS